MIHGFSLLTRRKDVSHEEMAKHHREIHGPLASVPGKLKYVGYYVDRAYAHVSIGPKEIPLPFDAIVFRTWTDEAFKNIAQYYGSEKFKQIHADAKQFVGEKGMIKLLSRESLSAGKESKPATRLPLVKTISLLNRRKGMSHEACVTYHKESYVPLVKSFVGQGIQLYEAYYVYAANYTRGKDTTPPYEIVDFTWYEGKTWEDIGQFFKTEEGRQLAEDETRWLDQQSAITMVVDESVFI